MSDLIDRQKALHALVTIDTTRYCVPCREVLMAIKNMPSAEPQKRKTGKWIHDGSHWANRWICDRCKYKLFGVKTKFCPDCGQRMEVDNESND